MDQFETSIAAFSTQCDLIKSKTIRHIWQMGQNAVTPKGNVVFVQTTRERQMKAKLFYHVGIPPLAQQRLLSRAEPNRTSPREFVIGGGRAEVIEFTHACLRYVLQTLQIALWRQREELTYRRQFPAIAGGRGKRCRYASRRSVQPSEAFTLRQSKGRFQRSMKPVFARCHRDVMQIGHIQLSSDTPRATSHPNHAAPNADNGPSGGR